MATNTQVSGYSAISQYLFQVSTLKNNAFYGGSLDNVHAKALLMVRKAFDWAVINNTASALTLNPYLYSLCGAKLQESIAIYNGGGGSVVPSPIPGGGGIIPYTLIHTVTLAESGSHTIQNSDWVNLLYLSPTFVINDTVYTLLNQYTYTSDGTFNFSLSSYTFQTGDIIASGGYKQA